MGMHETEAQNDDLPQIFAVGQPVDGQHTFNRRDFLKAAAAATVAGAALAACGGPKKVDPPAATLSPDEMQTACHSLYAHEGNITIHAISPDGRYMATSSTDDDKVKIWTLPNGELIKTVDDKETFHQVAFTPDSGLLLLASSKEIRTWTLSDGKSQKTLKGHPSSVDQLVLSPDGTRLASVGADHEVRVWSLPEGEHLMTLPDQVQGIRWVAFTPDNAMLIVIDRSSGPGNVRLFSLPDGALALTLAGTADQLWATTYALSPDGTMLAVAYGNTIKLWSLPEGTYRTLDWEQDGYINSLTITPDGSMLIAGGSGGGGGRIQWCSLPDGALTMVHQHTDVASVTALSVSPDATGLITQDSSTYIELWTLPDFIRVKVINRSSGRTVVAPDHTCFLWVDWQRIQAYSLPDETFITCFVDMEANSEDDAGVEIEVEGRTYTQPCGAPIPAGATCTCNCVAGGLCSCVGHRSSGGSRGGSSSYWYPN